MSRSRCQTIQNNRKTGTMSVWVTRIASRRQTKDARRKPCSSGTSSGSHSTLTSVRCSEPEPHIACCHHQSAELATVKVSSSPSPLRTIDFMCELKEGPRLPQCCTLALYIVHMRTKCFAQESSAGARRCARI